MRAYSASPTPTKGQRGTPTTNPPELLRQLRGRTAVSRPAPSRRTVRPGAPHDAIVHVGPDGLGVEPATPQGAALPPGPAGVDAARRRSVRLCGREVSRRVRSGRRRIRRGVQLAPAVARKPGSMDPSIHVMGGWTDRGVQSGSRWSVGGRERGSEGTRERGKTWNVICGELVVDKLEFRPWVA